jgi:hypothetical protein
LSSLGRKKEDPFAQKIITIKASHPIRKSSKSKSRQLQNKILAISTRERERERERERVPVDNKNTPEEAGDAEDGNPSGGEPIASLVRSAQAHSSISKKAFSFIRKRPRYKEKEGTPLEKEQQAMQRTRRKSDDVQNRLGNEAVTCKLRSVSLFCHGKNL